MSTFFRILLGIAIMGVGYWMVSKTHIMLEWLGTNDFAERKFGSGGSYLFYKLIGVLVVFIGIAVATNFVSDVLTSMARVLTNTKAQ